MAISSFQWKGKYHINTNTQTRVLGYITSVITILKNKDGISLENLSNELLSWSEENRRNLVTYHKNKNLKKMRGFIIKPEAAKNYIKLARSLKLIRKVGSLYVTTKYAEVLLQLQLDKNKNQNPFELTLAEKYFFLKRIIERDAAYFIPSLILIEKNDNSKTLSSLFKKKLLSYLNNLLKIMPTERQYLLERIKFINKWRNEKKYVENLSPPRFYWCLDLDLIKILSDKDKIYYKPDALLKYLLNDVKDVSLQKIKSVVDNNFSHIFLTIYKEKLDIKAQKPWSSLSYEVQKKIVIDRLDKLFRKTNKLNFIEFSNGLCIELVKKGVICEIEDIKNIFAQLAKDELYCLYWDTKLEDGVIAKFSSNN